MATYKDIHGFKIQNVSSDPPASFVGQVWYNTTSGDLKTNLGTPVGAWSTGGNMNTTTYERSAAGTQTATLAAGGSPKLTVTELYNGTSWTEVNDLNTARRELAGGGASNTNALAIGGNVGPAATSAVEKWNGSNWTNVASLNTASRLNAAAGAPNEAIITFGGLVIVFKYDNPFNSGN